MQRGYVMVFAVFLLVLGSVVAASATTYNYAVLNPNGSDVISIANAVGYVNGTPEAVGYSRNSGKSAAEPLLWTTSGTPTNLNTALGASATKLSGGYNEAYGIDSNGDVVGVCNISSQLRDFYLPGNGSGGFNSPTFLPWLGNAGAATEAVGVSNNGYVVGYGTNVSGTVQAFVWSALGGMVNLGPDGTTSYAAAISPNGQYIVGGTGSSGSLGQACEWQLVGSTWTLIGELALSLSNQSGGISVNNSGEVLGIAFPPYTGGPPSTSSFAFTAGAGFTNYTTFGSGAINSYGGINGSGAVVWTDSSSGPPMYNAAPTSGIDATDLGTLLATGQGTGYTMQGATGIDDHGDISILYATGPANRAALLTPVVTPEPSTLLLAVSGLLGLMAYAWRRSR